MEEIKRSIGTISHHSYFAGFMNPTTMKGPLYCATFYCLTIFVASQRFTCDPATDCTNATPALKVPDPTDCEKYYVCILVGGETIPSINSIQCAEGQYFDQVAGDCANEPTPGTCGPNTCPIRLCESECPPFAGIIYVADKYNCSSYYICLQPGGTKVTCSSDTPYFDGYTSTCVADASKCCDFCTAYCSVPGTQIVDPCDCTSYYICLVEGPALEGFKFSCASGTFYDEATATCQSGTCINICSNCGTNNPTTVAPTTAAPTTAAPTTAAPTTAAPTTAAPTTSSPPIETTTTLSAISTPTTPFGGCSSLESFTCPSNGNFQMCPYCFKYFFICSDGIATIGECTGNTLYNTNPSFPFCLDPSNCPYP